MNKNFQEFENLIESRQLSFFEIMTVPRNSFGLLVQFNIYFMLSYNTPLLTNHANNQGFSPSFSSIVMCSVAISYVLMSLIVTKLYKIISKRGIIFIGIFLSITGIIITGTVNLGTF